MSEIVARSLDNLPVEILYRIFDDLDIETIFFSIRTLCRYFQSIVDHYNRLHFDLEILSRYQFDALFRLISPENECSNINPSQS